MRGPRERFEWLDTIPDIVRNRFVSFRALRGMMIYEANEIIEVNGHDAVRRIFSRDDVAYINATRQGGLHALPH